MNHQNQDAEGAAPGNSGGKEGIRAELGLGAPRGWYSRGYLPHYNNTGTIQSVTFRLADSLPQTQLREIEEELSKVAPAKMDAERRKKVSVPKSSPYRTAPILLASRNVCIEMAPVSGK